MGATSSGAMVVAMGESSSAAPAMRVNAAGATRLQQIPCSAPAVARLRVNPTTAALAVAYPTLLGRPNMPDDVVFTMRP